MSRFQNNLSLYKPRMHPSVDAWFTHKNDQLNEEAAISGLNLGSNTTQEVESVEENRELLLNQIGIAPKWFADAEQVHGTNVQVISQGGTYTGIDGLVTQIPGLALAIKVADCAAVLLADPQQKVVAGVHAGWKGAVGGIVENAVQKMHELEAQPDHIHAFISPCISLSQFEVGDEVAELFPDSYVDYESYPKPHVDLKRFLIGQLIKLGIKSKHIETHEGCTVSDKKQFYSYRREGEASGRMMGIIRIKE